MSATFPSRHPPVAPIAKSAVARSALLAATAQAAACTGDPRCARRIVLWALAVALLAAPSECAATPVGLVEEYPVHANVGDIAAGPDGNLWYQRGALFGPTSGGLIGRITPQGEVSTFGTGLRSGAAVTNLVAGPDGNVWFADASSSPAIGRITPAGEITELGGIPPRRYPILEGPRPDPTASSGSAPTSRRPRSNGSRPTGRSSASGRASTAAPSWSAVHGRLRRSDLVPDRKEPPARARGRTGPHRDRPHHRRRQDHRIPQCLRPMPQFAGPNFLTLGPDGNVWFTTWPSGEDAHPTRASTPSIGRVTPAGRITEFRLGLHERSQPEELTAADGSLWFIDRGATAIGRIVTPRKPPNTFLVLAPKRRRGSAEIRLPVVTPGPGALRHHTWGRRSITRRAHGCGTTFLPARRGAGVARVTFRPRRGSPYTRRIKLR